MIYYQLYQMELQIFYHSEDQLSLLLFHDQQQHSKQF